MLAVYKEGHMLQWEGRGNEMVERYWVKENDEWFLMHTVHTVSKDQAEDFIKKLEGIGFKRI